MGFALSVEYKLGRSNVVADALSRRAHEEAILMAVSMPQLSLFDQIRLEQQGCDSIQHIIKGIHEGTVVAQWSLKNRLLHFKNRVYLDPSFSSIQGVFGKSMDKPRFG